MKPSFVLDCSLTMAWCFRNEATPATEQLLDRMGRESAAVPDWWFLEVANVLALAERRRRIRPAQVAEFVALLEGFELEVDDHAGRRAFTHLLPLCRGHGLTCYDAVYLELALRRRLPLATLDDHLRGAAKKLGVPVIGK